ncbi:AraC family transcriptional regulator [Neptunomonas japonica JAMM 1380]|uniref:AraC family transcriptional regulator n=1 Tax=Neptunomonas japonica JAMM 1380 TaxID=1441457 RepID=A0A7R6P651_9GAMM|nr:AraC family transcriptional regulator [Neptunomonas japonica JAMM 1380]
MYPNIKLLDLAGPLQVFTDALDERGVAVYKTVILSLDGNSINSDTPVSLSTEPILEWTEQHIDTLIVVGGLGARIASQNTDLLASITELASKSKRIGSICSGAFVLAACGLLKGYRAVTHWESCEELGASYPDIKVEPEPIFINDRNVWTSAGVTAGLDMALAMVCDDLGRSAALYLARSLVTYVVRPGGQSQFSEALKVQTADGNGRFDSLHQWMRCNLDQDLRVSTLANQALMSARNFARLYVAETKQTPAKAVEAMRVEAARTMLENGKISIKVIAKQCGFGNEEGMRRSFVRLIKVTPSDYEKRFKVRYLPFNAVES